MNKVYDIITEKILAQLEKGKIPWRKPWTCTDHKNIISRKPYRGINVWMLDIAAEERGYKSHYWLTYKQAQKLGGTVRKGEKANIVVFWKINTREDEDGEEKSFPFLRYYNVFNVEQCDGIDAPAEETISFDPIEKCEAIVSNMPNRPDIKHAGDRACYYPSLDYVNMPHPETFENEPLYYSVLFHELAHSTGHPGRLDRFGTDNKPAPFGSPDYSKEELIAEMTAAMLCATVNIENNTLENSAAYIQSWLTVLNDDPKMVVHAAGKAQKAADFITGELDD